MLLIKTGMDNTLICTPGQLLPAAYSSVSTFIINIFNAVFNYTFTLTDTGAHPMRCNRFVLTVTDIAGMQEGDYTYTIGINALPGTILDTGRLQVYTPPVTPASYNNTTEHTNAYIP